MRQTRSRPGKSSDQRHDAFAIARKHHVEHERSTGEQGQDASGIMNCVAGRAMV